MATTTVTLAKDATTITLNGPEGPSDVNCHPNWVSQLSEGLQRWSYRGTDTHLEAWALRLESLTLAQTQALRGFFYETVKGPTSTFTYTHTDGVSYTARFVNTGLKFQRRAHKDWACQIELEISGTDSGAGVNAAAVG